MNPDELKERTDEPQESIAETVENLKVERSEWQQELNDRAANLAASADAYIRSNPWVAVGIVAMYAFALGLIVGNRRD